MFVSFLFKIPVIQQKNFVARGFWVRRYEALVVSVPIPLRTQRAGAAQEVRGTSDLRGPEWNVEPRDAKLFYGITENKKVPTNTWHKLTLKSTGKSTGNQLYLTYTKAD